MKKVVLFCAHGFSTAMMRDKISEAAKKAGLDYEIEAYSYSEFADHIGKMDMILLGPQIRYNLRNVQAKCPDIPIEVIDMQSYAAMDGEKILKLAREKLGD